MFIIALDISTGLRRDFAEDRLAGAAQPDGPVHHVLLGLLQAVSHLDHGGHVVLPGLPGQDDAGLSVRVESLQFVQLLGERKRRRYERIVQDTVFLLHNISQIGGKIRNGLRRIVLHNFEK